MVRSDNHVTDLMLLLPKGKWGSMSRHDIKDRILLVACSETDYYQLSSNIKVKVTSMHWVIMWTTLATCTILKGKKCHMKQWETAVSLAGPWEPLNEKISYKSFGMAHAISNLIHYYFISVDSLSTPASGHLLCYALTVSLPFKMAAVHDVTSNINPTKLTYSTISSRIIIALVRLGPLWSKIIMLH